MSSTDQDDMHIKRIFDRKVVPAAELLRARGAQYFELSPSIELRSYFVERGRGKLAASDFEWPVVRSRGELEVRLQELWNGQPELIEMIDEIIEIAQQPEFSEEGNGEVSDLVYPMY